MTTTTGPDPTDRITDLKRQQRVTWAAGDYARVARHLLDVGDRIARRVGVGPDDEVLDVACGTGNAAIPAARAGGRVTGVDLTPRVVRGGPHPGGRGRRRG